VRLVPIALALIAASQATAVLAHAETRAIGGGYELIYDGVLAVKKGGRRATLASGGYYAVGGAKVDLRGRKVAIPIQSDCNNDEVTFTFARLDAHLEHAAASALHQRRAWADASKGFARAVQADPSWRLPAHELASSEIRRGDLAAAAAALAPWLRSEPAATYVHASLEPELQPLLATPAFSALRASKPTKLAVTTKGIDGELALSAERGLVAMSFEWSSDTRCFATVEIAVFELAGKLVARIPLATSESLDCTPDPPRTEVAPRRVAQVAKLLSELGFARTEAEAAGVTYNDRGIRIARLPKARLGVAIDGRAANVLRGNRSLATGTLGERNPQIAYHLPAAKLVIIGAHSASDSCQRYSVDAFAVP
jgi:hypothetical protein